MKTSSSVPHQIPFPAAWSCRARCAASGVETAARDAAGAASARRSRPLTSAAKALPPHRASTSDASVRRSRCASYARATAASCASDASPTTRASSGATSSRRASPISAAVSAAANGSTAAAGGAALLLCASSRSSATASGSSFRAFSRSGQHARERAAAAALEVGLQPRELGIRRRAERLGHLPVGRLRRAPALLLGDGAGRRAARAAEATVRAGAGEQREQRLCARWSASVDDLAAACASCSRPRGQRSASASGSSTASAKFLSRDGRAAAR